eukprot:6486880-Amphidinium_carterae.2
MVCKGIPSESTMKSNAWQFWPESGLFLRSKAVLNIPRYVCPLGVCVLWDMNLIKGGSKVKL